MYQAGYCVGLFFISPLGDLVRCRQLILALLCITTCLSVGLALSRSVIAFCTLAVLLGVFNVTPQILIPMAADLAAPQHRARIISILQSGLMLGILGTRVLSGVIGYYTTWHTVYYIAIGVQVIVLCGAYVLIPDRPPKNLHLTYGKILHTMVTYSVTEPRLVQAALINFASIACWTKFWVTLTFLLGGDPYHFSTLYIGLFGLIGILGIFSGPLASRLVDRFGTWYTVLVATICLLVLQCVEVIVGGVHISVVVIMCFGIDAFRQMQTLSLQMSVLSISEEARSRLNATLTVSLFAGQVMGSSVGSHVFLRYGWRASAGLSVGLYGWQLLVLFMRGPNCERHVWFGYEGGVARSAQEHAKTGSHVASACDGTEMEMTKYASAETLVHATSCWPGKHA
ncbi:major facilitator superfamily domain-containing protein [Boletus edulis BED1]|uniref:Major facilitator superfamily domain-containing protein n=1 Tax=Boletus edulis BED1 TaxID=1328754 RepID=A0AAD4BVD0_BOLED|nr:major facilitator superfamily domain-containing protein [Boletus edulis BED1]